MFNFRCPSLPTKIKHGHKIIHSRKFSFGTSWQVHAGSESHIEPIWRMSMDEVCVFVATTFTWQSGGLLQEKLLHAKGSNETYMIGIYTYIHSSCQERWKHHRPSTRIVS